MVGEGQIRQGRGLGHMTRRAIGAAGTATGCPPHMAQPALGIVRNARGGIGVRIMACDAIERLFGPAAAHITAAHRQAHRSKTHTQRILHLRSRRGILAERRAVAGSAGLHGTVPPDHLRHGMSPLRAVASLTMHPRTIRRHVTAKAAGRVLIALHHAKRLLPRRRRLKRMPRRQAQPVRRGVPTQAMLHPTAGDRQHRRAREAASPKQPRNRKGPCFPAPFYPNLLPVKPVDRPAALS